jgi:hypothetical protein
MGNVTYSSISSALATIFEDRIVSQANRSVVALQLLDVEGADSKECRWDTDFPAAGEATDSSSAEGATVATYENDDLVPASLPFTTYQMSFQVTGLARALARVAGNPNALEDLFGEKIMRVVELLTKNIGTHIYTGTGSSNQIAGMIGSGMLSATGTYAGINRATYTQWASNHLANGGTPRALTFDLMRSALKATYNASGESPDLILCDATQFEKFGALFDSARQFHQDIFLRGKKITLMGGYNALFYDGIPVVRDVRCSPGEMLFLNTKYVKLKQVPDFMDDLSGAIGKINLQGTPEADFGSMSTGLTAVIHPLAVVGDIYPYQLKLYFQMLNRRPNSCARLADLSV